MKKSYRVKKAQDFQLVFDAKQSMANRYFVIYQLNKPNQKHFRVGLSVGKKIGNAVVRNQVKRYVRQSLTELKPQLQQDVDFLVIARKGVGKLSMAEVKSNLIHVLKLAKLLTQQDQNN